MGDVLAVEEIWADSRQGDRPNEADLVKAFGTSEVFACAAMILEKGTIQLTTQQRKAMTEEKRKKIVHAIASTATDPRTKSPHPRTRIENALEESRFSVDPFLSVERQVEDAIKVLKPLIPLQFVMAKMAFRIPGSDYGGVLGVLRDLVERRRSGYPMGTGPASSPARGHETRPDRPSHEEVQPRRGQGTRSVGNGPYSSEWL